MQGKFDVLAWLLRPCQPEEFLAESWGKNFKHIPGWQNKFAQLLPWDDLDTILRQHRLDFPRIRLTKEGQSAPASSYLKHIQSGARKVRVPRLLPSKLVAQLRTGATLVLDAVDELHSPLEELSRAMEWIFHERVQINGYAGWHTSRGFDLHWDEHDVFILQVAGRKRWSIYGTTRPFPIMNDIEPAARPDCPPIWEAILNQGDLLYIPRGWWHVAFPLQEPTLHLTVGIHNRNGIDFLRWLADHMRSSEHFRKDIPRFSGSEQPPHINRLRSELEGAFTDSILQTYFEEIDSRVEPRDNLSLPWSVSREPLPDDLFLRLTSRRPIKIASKGDAIEFCCIGTKWRFAPEANIVLTTVADGLPHSVRELVKSARSDMPETTARKFLAELLQRGLLSTVTPHQMESMRIFSSDLEASA